MKLALLASNGNEWVSYVLIGVLVAIMVVTMIFMNRRSKKREKEAQELMDAVKPGNKVTTIGGIVGIVVEVNPEDNTIVVETGSEEHGKSYIKFIRQAIYESDAVVDKKEVEAAVEAQAEEPATETATEAPVEAAVEEVTPVTEVKEDETVVAEEEVKPAKSSKKKKKNN